MGLTLNHFFFGHFRLARVAFLLFQIQTAHAVQHFFQDFAVEADQVGQ